MGATSTISIRSPAGTRVQSVDRARLSQVSGESAALAVVTAEGLTGKVLLATRGDLVPESSDLVRFTDTTIVSAEVLEAAPRPR